MYQYIFKNILNPLHESVIKGRDMLKYRAFLEKSQWWPYERLQAFQWEELVKLLKHAYENVPYWHNQFDRLELKPSDIKTYEDFCRMSVIDKNNIRESYEQMRAVNYTGKTWKKSTGGSTGEPLHFEYTPESYDWRVATSRRGYSWAGCEDGVKQAYIWGVAIGKIPLLKKLRQDIHRVILRQKYYNCFGFTEEKMAETLRNMNKFKPEYIVGYTNPLYEFVKYVEKSKKLQFKPKAIISAAEKLHEFQREKIRAVFGCPVFNTYGSREFMLIAAECEERNGMHLSIENLFVEILREDGRPAKNGEMGEIVITDLHNYGMPFIRYKIGDLGIATDRICPCGRGLPLIDKIEGRVLDVIRTPDGRVIPGEFFPHLMKEFPAIKKFQVIQKKPDMIVIKVVVDKDTAALNTRLLEAEIAKTLGFSTSVTFEFINDIPLTITGKMRVVISDIKG